MFYLLFIFLYSFRCICLPLGKYKVDQHIPSVAGMTQPSPDLS